MIFMMDGYISINSRNEQRKWKYGFAGINEKNVELLFRLTLVSAQDGYGESYSSIYCKPSRNLDSDCKAKQVQILS